MSIQTSIARAAVLVAPLMLGCDTDPVEALEFAGPDFEPRVYQGELALPCQWPTVVAHAGCTGTLIHPELVLTEAACIHAATPSEIILGESALDPIRTVAVESCTTHPDWTVDTWSVDNVGYCRLASPVLDLPATPPIYGCELEQLLVNHAIALVGFGKAAQDGSGGLKRWAAKTATVPQVDEHGRFLVNLFGNCASGDDGAPLFVQLDDESLRVFAQAIGTTEPCSYGVWAVMLDRYVPWIEQSSGIDITPCHDLDGTWNPGPDCGHFLLDPLAEAEWANECAALPSSGYSHTCGEPFADDSGEETGGADTPLDTGDEQGDPSLDDETDEQGCACTSGDERSGCAGCLFGLLALLGHRRSLRRRRAHPPMR